jgi:hypothetical protein
MKTNLSLIFSFCCCCCLAPNALSQDINLFRNKTFFALGELSSLPDSILFLEDFRQINEFTDYTKLEKKNNISYILLFWAMSRRGIVDPAIYRVDLKIIVKGKNIILKFGNHKKEYQYQSNKDKIGVSILLKVKNNNR